MAKGTNVPRSDRSSEGPSTSRNADKHSTSKKSKGSSTISKSKEPSTTIKSKEPSTTSKSAKQPNQTPQELMKLIDSDNLNEFKKLVTAENANCRFASEPLLLRAAANKKLGSKFIAHLLEMKASPIIIDMHTGQCVIHSAARNNNTEVIEIILKKFDKNSNKLINAKDEYNTTPLMVAAVFKHYDAINILLNYKADVTAVDKGGHTACDYTSDEKCRRILDSAAKQGVVIGK